jgi:hypothetical protein
MTLTAALALLAAALLGATAGILALLVIGIRRDDRAKNLTGTPATPVEAITRRVLGVGVRNGCAHQDHDEER